MAWEITIVYVVGFARVAFVGIIYEPALSLNQLDLLDVLIWIGCAFIREDPLLVSIGSKTWMQLDLLIWTELMRSVPKEVGALFRRYIKAS